MKHLAPINDESVLLSVAVKLGALNVPGLSLAEADLLDALPRVSSDLIDSIRNEILQSRDPLGDAFCKLRSPETRRPRGATYTPASIVRAMIQWSQRYPTPTRIVDPGAGSGRFMVAAGRAFAASRLVGTEIDPVAALACRGHLAAAGLAGRATVLLQDYRSLRLDPLPVGQRTLFIGNPPYVRHHLIPPAWKEWLAKEGRKLDLKTSALAGLHVHFYVATANLARQGDLGCIITAAEWLDVNYGRMVRELVLHKLGGSRLVVLEPTAAAFPDAQTTAAIVCMEVGKNPQSIVVQRIESCGDLNGLRGGVRVRRERFEVAHRWSQLTRRMRKAPQDYIELGELCRVHRGQVTGANDIWIAGLHCSSLPESVLFPTVTKARELFAAGSELTDAGMLRKVVDIPADLDLFDQEQRQEIESFLRYAKDLGADRSYIAQHRKPWWSVGLREPAPILATYMARRPPAFVLNRPGARHLNIAHGLYPRQRMEPSLLEKLAAYLNRSASLSDGRAYAGGLTKFEPKEMERLLVPDLVTLQNESLR